MPSPEEVYAELEADRASREAELRLIERTMAASSSEQDRAMLKRSLVMLTYSHLEGFCKFSLAAYAGAINAMGLTCDKTTPAITAAALNSVFSALRNPSKKHDVFRKTLPDDVSLHMIARDQEFIEGFARIIALRVVIADRVIDTKSNIDTDILKKLLFQLGLPYSSIEAHRGSINKLLGVRNAIAHGDRLKIPTDDEVSNYVGTAFAVMQFLQGEVFGALASASYLKSPAA